MDNDALADAGLAAVEVLEIAFREVLVELVAAGKLDTWDIAKAMLRTEITAQTFDEVNNPGAALRLARARQLREFCAKRLMIEPDLFALRKLAEKSRKGFDHKDHPYATASRPQQPDAPAR